MSRWIAGLVMALAAALALLFAFDPGGERAGPEPEVLVETGTSTPELQPLQAPGAIREDVLEGAVFQNGSAADFATAGPAALAGLAGRVVDRQGHPVAGALVFHGGISGIADTEGRFRLNGLPPRPTALVATALGFQPARLAPEQARAGEWLEVVLAGRALSITGIVVDRDGTPWPGLRVDLADGLSCDATPAPDEGPPPAPGLFAETIASGAEFAVSTGSDGRFRIDGLSQRLYQLRFTGAGLEEPTEQRARAGEELRIELPFLYPGTSNDGLARDLQSRIDKSQD